jgi:hypothetical protein
MMPMLSAEAAGVTAGEEKVKRSVRFDADVHRWLVERARRSDRSVDREMNRILRDAMNAEYRATTTDIDVEQGG